VPVTSWGSAHTKPRQCLVRVKTINGTSLLAQHELPELATGGGIQSRVSHVIDMIRSNGQHSEAKRA